MTTVDTLRRLGTAAITDPRADGELLTHFVRTRDERAFAELLRRHGPAVYGVCRRALGPGPDADDAFQAVFLVLVQSAAAVRPPGMVGNWLHGVAVRTAKRARAMALQRVLRERAAAARTPEAADEPDAETLAILDAELAALPVLYRAVLVACDLNGRSRSVAAKELGWAEGTVATRLAKGRQLLADRLRRRSVTLAVGAAVATAGVPRALAAQTLAAAHELITTGTAGVAPSILQLTTQVVSAMTRPKLNVLAVGLAALVLLAGGLGVWKGAETTAAPVPKTEKDDGLIWLHDRPAKELVAYSPDLTERKRVKLPAGERFFGLTPDGSQALYADKPGGTYHLRPLDGDGQAVDLGLDATAKDVRPRWNPAGTQFVRQRVLDDPDRPLTAYRFDLFDVASKKAVPLDHLDGHWLLGWADGDHLVSRVKEGDGYDSVYRTSLGGELTVLLAGDQFAAQHLAVAADGGAFVGGRRAAVRGGKKRYALWAVDLKSGELNELFRDDDQQVTTPACAPDGRRVAFTWECRKDRTDLDQFRLSVVDRDGTNLKTITLADAAKGDDTDRWSLLGWYPSKPDPRRVKAPVPKAKDDGLIWAHNTDTDTLTAYTPDGKAAKAVQLPDGVPFFGLTPDGTRMAFGGKKGKGSKEADALTLHVGNIDEECEGEDTGLGCKPTDRMVWSADAKRVVRVRLETAGPALPRPGDKPSEYSHTLYDLAGRKETAVTLPDGHKVMGWSADGKAWRVSYKNGGADPKLPHIRWFTTPADGKGELVPVCDTVSFNGLAQDGREFVGVGWKHGPNESPGEHKLFRVADAKETVLARFESGAVLSHAHTSPDGRRVVCQKLETSPKGAVFDDTAFVMFDADGKNETQVVRFAEDHQATQLLGWFAGKPADPKAQPPAKEPVKAPVPRAVPREGVIVLSSFTNDKGDPLEVVKPDGTPVKVVKPDGHFKPWRARLSADGSRVAFLNVPPVENPKVKWWTLQTVGWLDLDAKEAKPHTIVEVAYHPSVVMSADGKSVYYSHVDMAKVGNEPRKGENLPFESWAFDTTTEKKTRLELPADHLIRDVSADGRMLLTTTTELGSSRQEAYVVPVATMKPERLTEATLLVIHSPRFSPDGGRVVWGKMPEGPSDEKTTGVFVTDVVTKRDTRVNLPKGIGGEFFCWSPDGKRIATSGTRPVSDVKGADTVCEVAVCDADGSNAKVIMKREPNRPIMSFDWR